MFKYFGVQKLIVRKMTPGDRLILEKLRNKLFVRRDVLAYSEDEARDEHGRWTAGDWLAHQLDAEGDPAEKAKLRTAYTNLTEAQGVDHLEAVQKKAVGYYLYKGNETINDYLRNGVGGGCDQCPVLDLTIGDTYLDRDQKVYRGAALRDNVIASLLPGAVIKDSGYVSTSLNARTAYAFANKAGGDSVTFVIDVPKGSHALAASTLSSPDVDYSGERELILPRGAKFQVESVGKLATDDWKTRVVKVKYIGSEPTPLPESKLTAASKRTSGRKFVWMPGDFKIIKLGKIKAYSPDEPRDESGKWAQGGDTSKAYTVKRDDYSSGARAHFDSMKPPGATWAESNANFDKMTDAQKEKYLDAADKVRQAEKAWDRSTREALSEGNVSVADAKARGFETTGWDSPDPYDKKKGWQPLPDTLYHVTTAKSAVLAEGLKSRAQLGQTEGKGLGGGDDETISFTTNKEGAENMYHTMHEALGVASGEIGIPRLLKAAEEGRAAKQPFMTQLMGQYISSTRQPWQPGDPLPPDVQNLIDGREEKSALGLKVSELPKGAVAVNSWPGGDGEARTNRWTEPADPERLRYDRFQFYKNFLQTRQSAGGPENPLFFSTDVKGLSKVPKSEIAIVKAKPVFGAQGYPMSALDEWRTHSGKAVKITGVETPLVDIRACRFVVYGKKAIAAYSEDEPRDSAGKWVSGTGTHYHGTSTENLAGIRSRGIVPKYAIGGEVASVYTTPDKVEALGYGLERARVANNDVVLVVADGRKLRVRESTFGHSETPGVPASAIRRIEVYRRADLEKAFKADTANRIAVSEGKRSGSSVRWPKPYQVLSGVGIKAYSLDEPRDERGRWTKGGPGGIGEVFVSPNVEENLTFKQAKANLKSERQTQIRTMAVAVAHELTPNVKDANIIGDWADGAENSILLRTGIKDRDALDYAASKMGLAAQQKAVIAFLAAKGGKDTHWTMRVAGNDLRGIRKTLQKSGVAFRSLEPHGDSTLVHVFDPGTTLKRQIHAGAEALRASVTMVKGNGEFIGSEDSREAGAKEYQKRIDSYKAEHKLAASRGRRGRNRKGNARKSGGDFHGRRLPAEKGSRDVKPSPRNLDPSLFTDNSKIEYASADFEDFHLEPELMEA